MAAANIVAQGTISTSACLSFAGGFFLSCNFSGIAVNTGQGCAANVQGTITVFSPAGSNTQVNSATWAYSGTVPPNGQIVFSGGPIIIPTLGGWSETNNIIWTTVGC
jgi:hypothetical protein